jgi:cation:H+ antiporter
MIVNILLCIAGFLMLYYGAEWLVKGSSSLARSLGVTPVVIGLTVVAFGTSTPEFVVSVISSITDKSMIAVGNVVGSNICNLALVLGASALFQPVTSHPSVVRRDIPLMLLISLYLLILSLDSTLSRLEGATLFAGIVLYTLFNYWVAGKEGRKGLNNRAVMEELGVEEVPHIEPRSRQIVLIVVGILGVVFGAKLVVDSAVAIMQVLGVSEKFIGLTIVALGTSLPELATSVVAAIRKEMDISIGNLVGSNVFNVMGVLGAASLVRPVRIPGGFVESGLIFDYFVMVFTSLLPLFFMRRTNTISRAGGAALLVCYVVYIGFLVWKA